ncbi:hypothetical protein [Ureibacillus chungkukjangi]|nr:hypothetical protein [Ureibacillus chungkukjangi]
MQIFFAGFIIIASILGLKKRDYTKLKEERRKQPSTLLFQIITIIGYLLFVSNITLFDNYFITKLAISLIFIGVIFNTIKNWKSISKIQKVKLLALGLLILLCTVYLF